MARAGGGASAEIAPPSRSSACAPFPARGIRARAMAAKLQRGCRAGRRAAVRAVILRRSSCKEFPLSFFDEDEPPPTEIRQSRAPRPPAPASRRPRRAAAGDHHATIVRRRILAGVLLVVPWRS